MSQAPVPTFDELLERHQREILRVCRSILRDEHLGCDAAQETFLRSWRRIREGRAPENWPAWLRKVAITTSLDFARQRASRARVHTRGTREETQRALEQIASVDPDHENEAESRELRRRFEAALTELPEGQRTVFLLRHEGGISLAEVAETLGVSLPTAKTHFARACLKLQHKLAHYRPDEAETQ